MDETTNYLNSSSSKLSDAAAYMADMDQHSETSTPDEVLMDLRLGIEVTDRELSLATAASTGRTRERLWREVMTRVMPAVDQAARRDGTEAESFLLWRVAREHDSSVADSVKRGGISAGGIRNYSAWVHGVLARGLAGVVANVEAGRAPHADIGATALQLTRSAELDGSVAAARAEMLADGYGGDLSDEAFGTAQAVQAVAAPISLAPLAGEGESWTHALEADVVAPEQRAEGLDEAGQAVLRERLGMTDIEWTVTVAEWGIDGTEPVTGARAIAEETGLDYDDVRKAQTTAKRRLRRLSADELSAAFTEAREVVGTPTRALSAARKRRELAAALAA